MYRTKVAGTGSYLPEKVLSNADLEKMVDTNDQWIVERTGIQRRHIAAPNQATSDLATEAARRALASANMTPEDIDLIMVATITGDHLMPSTSCYVQNNLGVKIPAFDLAAACSGFIYGLHVADNLIRTGAHKNILLIGAETISRYVNYKDRETCVLFGDAAGAFVLTRADANDTNLIMSTHLQADGSLSDLLILPAGGSRMPVTKDVIDEGKNFMAMKGKEIFKNAVKNMAQRCEEALAFNKVTADQVDWLIPHQANLRIIDAVADYYKFPKEKVVINIQETGNTSAATIPTAFDMAITEGKIKRGQTILLTAFGAGLTSGSCLMKF